MRGVDRAEIAQEASSWAAVAGHRLFARRTATGVRGAKEVDGQLTWIPAGLKRNPPVSLYRARIDVELIVDGKVIDLNRIPLPPDTPVIDRRWTAK